jgi:hypothetical protein
MRLLQPTLGFQLKVHASTDEAELTRKTFESIVMPKRFLYFYNHSSSGIYLAGDEEFNWLRGFLDGVIVVPFPSSYL